MRGGQPGPSQLSLLNAWNFPEMNRVPMEISTVKTGEGHRINNRLEKETRKRERTIRTLIVFQDFLITNGRRNLRSVDNDDFQRRKHSPNQTL